MRFWTGALAGMLVAGPAAPATVHHTTETTNVVVRVAEPEPTLLTDSLVPWGEVEGQEACVIELLGGPLATWDADDVIGVLDEAWSAYDGPCHMAEEKR